MPWWSLVYLVILTLLSLAGIIELFRTKQIIHGLATAFSLICFCLFVAGVFKPDLAEQLGIYVIPMLILVALYDWWLADLDLQPGSSNFFKPLPDVKSKLNDKGALLILLPAYVSGLYLSYHALI